MKTPVPKSLWIWPALLAVIAVVRATGVGEVPSVSAQGLKGPQTVVSLGGALPTPLPLFPADNWWNLDISAAPVDANSAAFISFINSGNNQGDPLGRHAHPDFGGEESPGSTEIYGFPYIVVDGSQLKKTVQFGPEADDESDGVNHNTNVSFPFYPIPDQAITQDHWIEAGQPGNQDERDNSDRHMLMVDRDNKLLYELYNVFYDGATWRAYSGALFDMKTNDRRPEGWTSADAAGLAILPGLVRRDEVIAPGPINHAFRVTVRASNGHVYPASHTAGSAAGALPMGARLRLKNSKNISGYTAEMQRIFQAMKTYGLIVADNGSDLYVSGTFDVLWDNGVLNPAFHSLHASDFEVIQLGYNPPPSGPPAISINNATITEGNSGSANATFTVTLSLISASTVTVAYATANGTTNPAAAPGDYTTTSNTLTFAPGETSKPVTVAVVGDTLDEPDETFFVNLTSPTNATILDGQGLGTITDNDPTPTLSVGDVTLTEGNSGTAPATFTVTLSAASGRTVTVAYATANGTTNPATTPADYTATSNTLTFAAGETSKQVSVLVVGDALDEPDETFFVNLSSPTNATLLDAQGLGAITDNDPTPTLSINDVALTEGNSGTAPASFTVTLSAASGRTVTVNYATADVTALSGRDYVAASGTLTFTPGTTTQPVVVQVNGEIGVEVTETFAVNLTSPVNATIADAQGVGTINDNDAGGSRVFASVSGHDANDCATITTPCRSLAQAVFQVAVSGEIIVLSSGEYDTAPLIISKSVKLTSPSGTVTFVRQPITINAPGSRVVLRGLTLKGAGAGNGITVAAADALFIEECTIDRWSSGLVLGAGASAVVAVMNSVFVANTMGIQSLAGGTSRVQIEGVRFEGNATGLGLHGGAFVLRDTALYLHAAAGLVIDAGSVDLQNADVSLNGVGVSALSGGTVRISRSRIFGNTTGLQASPGGSIASSGTNVIRGNLNNTSGAISAAPEG